MSWPLRLGLLASVAALSPAAGGTTMLTPILTTLPSGSPSNSVTRFYPLVGGINGGVVASSNGQARTPIAIPGTISLLTGYFQTAVTTGDYTITMQKNGVDTALVITITSGNLIVDSTHSVSVVAGDDICFKSVPTGTPTAQTNQAAISVLFTATNAGESLIFGCTGATTVTTSSYMAPGGSQTYADDATGSCLIAAPGVLDHLYVRSSAVPGGAAAWTFTAQQNETPTALACIITSAISTNSDLVDALTVAAGDRLSVAAIATLTPAAAGLLWSMRWVPTTNGNSLLFMKANGTLPANSADRFLPLATQCNNVTTEVTLNVAPLACTIKNLYVRQLPQITAGTSRAFTLRAGTGGGQSSQSLTVTFTNGGATDDHDTTNSYSASSGDILDLLVHPVGTPTALTALKIGAVAYIAPI